MRPAIASCETTPYSQKVGDVFMHAIDKGPLSSGERSPQLPRCIVVRMRHAESPAIGVATKGRCNESVDQRECRISHCFRIYCGTRVWDAQYLNIFHDGVIENRKEIIHT